jgi:hypothetical protein
MSKTKSLRKAATPPFDLADQLTAIHLAARRNELSPSERMQLSGATRGAQLQYLEAESPQAGAIARGRPA